MYRLPLYCMHALIRRAFCGTLSLSHSARDEALRLKGEADARAALEVIAREFATKERERVEAAMDRVRYEYQRGFSVGTQIQSIFNNTFC